MKISRNELWDRFKMIELCSNSIVNKFLSRVRQIYGKFGIHFVKFCMRMKSISGWNIFEGSKFWSFWSYKNVFLELGVERLFYIYHDLLDIYGRTCRSKEEAGKRPNVTSHGEDSIAYSIFDVTSSHCFFAATCPAL